MPIYNIRPLLQIDVPSESPEKIHPPQKLRELRTKQVSSSKRQIACMHR